MQVFTVRNARTGTLSPDPKTESPPTPEPKKPCTYTPCEPSPPTFTKSWPRSVSVASRWMLGVCSFLVGGYGSEEEELGFRGWAFGYLEFRVYRVE